LVQNVLHNKFPSTAPWPISRKLGYMTTPVIVIDGAVIVGFDSAKIDRHAADSNILGV
jgi:hypothetical protein